MKQIYSIHDEVSGAWGPLFLATNDHEVKRDFAHTIEEGKMPEYVARDSVVYCLGTADPQPESYGIVPFPVIRRVVTGCEVLGESREPAHIEPPVQHVQPRPVNLYAAQPSQGPVPVPTDAAGVSYSSNRFCRPADGGNA